MAFSDKEAGFLNILKCIETITCLQSGKTRLKSFFFKAVAMVTITGIRNTMLQYLLSSVPPWAHHTGHPPVLGLKQVSQVLQVLPFLAAIFCSPGNLIMKKFSVSKHSVIVDQTYTTTLLVHPHLTCTLPRGDPPPTFPSYPNPFHFTFTPVSPWLHPLHHPWISLIYMYTHCTSKLLLRYFP